MLLAGLQALADCEQIDEPLWLAATVRNHALQDLRGQKEAAWQE